VPEDLKSTQRRNSQEEGSASSFSSEQYRSPTKKKRQVQLHPKPSASQPNILGRITLPNEFKFNTALFDNKQSIRRRRFEEMLKAKQDIEECELNFKFRARKVPHFPAKL